MQSMLSDTPPFDIDLGLIILYYANVTLFISIFADNCAFLTIKYGFMKVACIVLFWRQKKPTYPWPSKVSLKYLSAPLAAMFS